MLDRKIKNIICDVHNSNIPQEIRKTEMKFNFKTDFSDYEIGSLDKKVDDFLSWYYDFLIKGHYIGNGGICRKKNIGNFIEKMASWYEMRYPDFVVNRLMSSLEKADRCFDDVLLNQNLSSVGGKDSFDYQSFLQTLSNEEKWYLRTPSFDKKYYMKDAYMGILCISKDGMVRADEVCFDMSEYHLHMFLGRSLYVTEDFNYLNLLQVKALMEAYHMVNDIAGIQKIIDYYQLQIEARERMLDCVMYRVIERGGNRIGPRRAFLFAKEFGRNLDIPMIYGIDYFDSGLRNFMNLYLKNGGSKDLVCCDNYFTRLSEKEKLSTVTVCKLIKTMWNNCTEKYTLEEERLYQRLVDSIQNYKVEKFRVLKKSRK